MNTIFYKARFERPVPVTYLLVERVSALLADSEPDEEVAYKAVRQAMIDCDSLGTPTDAQVAYVIQRLSAVAPKDGADKPAVEKDQDGKSFAGGFLKWIREMAPEDFCLFVSGNDYNRAVTLYCVVDKDDVMVMADRKVAEEWERSRISLEAALFGFGGGYGKDKGKDGIEMDLESGGGEGFKKLNQMLAFNG